MKAGFGLSIAAGVAALTAVAAGAQTAGAPAPSAPAQQQPAPPADTVGPRELRDFSIGGTPARPAAPATDDTPPPEQPPAPSAPASSAARTEAAPRPAERRPAAPTNTAAAETRAIPAPVPEPTNSAEPDISSPATAFNPAPIGEPLVVPPATEASTEANQLLLWPWLIAALVAALGAGFLLLRQRSRRELAGYGAEDDFAAPNPTPASPERLQRAAPRPAIQPTPMPPQAPLQRSPVSPSGGIVSTRLRPWIELEFTPGRCILDQTQATVEFLINVTNSGNSNARELRIDTVLFNAGPTQDEEIGAFFAHPPERGQSIDGLLPLKGVELRGSVSLPLDQLRILEAGGRQLFVPLIGLNARYRWSGGQGQTSRSFLLGREGTGDKMAPFRADLGPRVFRGLGARELQIKVRR